jgi:hypothetical protein
MKTTWLWLFAIVACSKSNSNPTPAGATVLDWKLALADRPAMHAATTTDVQAKDIAYDAHPTDDTTVKLQIHLETASVTFEETGVKVTRRSPIALVVKVVDGNDFTIGNGKCGGPNYPLTAPGDVPNEMLMDCRFKATKPRFEVGFMIYAYSDGHIDDGLMKKTKVM